MAHDIEDVWDELQDIKTTLNALNDLNPIKVKLDLVAEKADLAVTTVQVAADLSQNALNMLNTNIISYLNGIKSKTDLTSHSNVIRPQEVPALP